MMKKMKTIIAFLLFPILAQAQSGLTVELSIENQEVVGTDFFFDLYLTRHASSIGNIYLIDSDFLLTFNAGFFTNPTLEKVSNGTDNTGFCIFITTEGTAGSNQAARELYFSGTSATLKDGNLIILNLESPLPVSQPDFDGRISNIDNAPATHRLGRFRISGITDPEGTAGLQWVSAGAALFTKVFSFETAAPWPSQPVEIVSTPPYDFPLDSMVVSAPELPAANWDALKIYPNPSSAEMTVEFVSGKKGIAILSLFDESGVEVLQKKYPAMAGENKLLLHTADLPAGFYWVKIKMEGQVLTGKSLKN